MRWSLHFRWSVAMTVFEVDWSVEMTVFEEGGSIPNRGVISTGAMDSFIVHRIVERPPHFALFIGVTTEIEGRVAQHKNRAYEDSHTSKYRIDRLVHLEPFGSITEAIAREKQLKHWSRVKKLRIIVAENPTWRDSSAEWGKPIKLYSGE